MIPPSLDAGDAAIIRICLIFTVVGRGETMRIKVFWQLQVFECGVPIHSQTNKKNPEICGSRTKSGHRQLGPSKHVLKKLSQSPQKTPHDTNCFARQVKSCCSNGPLPSWTAHSTMVARAFWEDDLWSRLTRVKLQCSLFLTRHLKKTSVCLAKDPQIYLKMKHHPNHWPGLRSANQTKKNKCFEKKCVSP